LREQILAESSNCGSPRRNADEMKFATEKSRLFPAKKGSAKCVTPFGDEIAASYSVGALNAKEC
jgi:hypothetical protein